MGLLLQKYKIEINSENEQNIIKIDSSNDVLLKSNISLFQEYINKKLDNNFLKLKIEELLLHSLRINKNLFTSFLQSIITPPIKYLNN